MSWRDAALHIPLGLAFTGIAAATMALPWPLSAFAIGAEALYLREVVQEQADGGNDIRTGWNPFAWGKGKNVETWVPIAALIIAGLIMTR